jgi:hypothetical protein
LELTEGEQELFDKYDLAEVEIYSSDDRLQNQHAVDESLAASLDAGDNVEAFPKLEDLPASLGNVFSQMWNLGAAGVYSVLSSMSVQITLGSLCEGQTIETQSLEEMLQIKENITNSVAYLANYLSLALTFDNREELSEY